MAHRGFRTKIALHVLFLLLISAVVTDLLVVVIVQKAMVQEHLAAQRNLINAVGRLVLDRKPDPAMDDWQVRSLEAVASVPGTQWPAMLIVDTSGLVHYAKTSLSYPRELLSGRVEAAIRDRVADDVPLGVTWAVYWYHTRTVLVAVPLIIEGGLAGAVAAVVPLDGVYARIRHFNKPVYLYIIINTIVLAAIGLYRIFRIYLRPIDHIIRQADDYGQDEDLFFTFRQDDNELNRLSSSLNRMLKRISDDKRKLTDTVACLEAANKELVRARDEMIRAEKLASVGRLAAGIAHEIGNPIGIVLGYLDLLKQDDLPKAEHDEYADRAETEIQRINTIIRQLLDLARPKDAQEEATSVHAVIRDIVNVMAHQPMMADIRLDTRLTARQDTVRSNGDQLRQVFLNLLLNAADAIRAAGRQTGGTICIATRMVKSAEDGDEGEPQLVVSFQDDGEGMDEGQLDNIFDPFYTTKEPGKGTGLGLSVSFMIIERSGGTISARSRPGLGTCLTIRLPIITTTVGDAPGTIPGNRRRSDEEHAP
ncbi:MAG: hypothetical protein HKP58_07035 [Desulfatitalea sp.]|nr:hypothetical protein [Desulfatitalea sp.]NNK00151.1 hypothetical protein [Desulfatitalea sp.]